MSRTGLGIIATHPIQYQVPWFRGLVESGAVDLTVYFGMIPDAHQQGIGFGKPFSWDVPLLDGYRWKLLESKKKAPTLEGFWGNRLDKLASTFRQDGVEVMVITGWHAYPMLQALFACKCLNIPTIVRGESNAMRPRPWKARLLHRLLLPRYDAYLAIGESSAQFYRNYGIAESKIFFARYFIDNERFSTQADLERPQRGNYRAQWLIPEDVTCFLYVGKLEPKKRIFDILEALLALKRNSKARYKHHLLVVGSGELEAKARAFVDTHQLPVTFAGFMNQSEISKAYVAADALVLPSDFGETWGLVVNEAMVHGLPLMISDRVGCGADLVANKNTGWIFPFADIERLAECLQKVAEEKSLRLSRGENARKLIAAYSASGATQGTLEAVDFLSKKSGKASLQ